MTGGAGRRLVLGLALLAALSPVAVPGHASVVSAQNPDGARDSDWAAFLELEAQVRQTPESVRPAALYRRAVIATGRYDRAIDLFRSLVKAHPQSAEAHINLALACVDKVPVSGKFHQAWLGKEALDHLGTALAIRPLMVPTYIRGLVNLFYDAVIFNRVRAGVADLEEARRLLHTLPLRPYHAHIYVALGDGYWKLEDLARAKAIWSEGFRLLPDNAELSARVTKTGKDLGWTVRRALDPDHRVDTSLAEIWNDLPVLGLR